jgi:hypothetical protein
MAMSAMIMSSMIMALACVIMVIVGGGGVGCTTVSFMLVLAISVSPGAVPVLVHGIEDKSIGFRRPARQTVTLIGRARAAPSSRGYRLGLGAVSPLLAGGRERHWNWTAPLPFVCS